jgi:hypothetical protein
MATKSKALQALIEKAKTEKRASLVWKPSPGDCLAGTVIKLKKLPGRGRDAETGRPIPYLSVTIADENGELRVCNAGTLLADEIEAQDLEVGDICAIVYHGTEKTGSGHSVGVFTLAVEKKPK